MIGIILDIFNNKHRTNVVNDKNVLISLLNYKTIGINLIMEEDCKEY
ncbi:MAG: hypothetical protein K0R71_1684 [Bacillales bacterium]|jgi:hypothetical protein|nr:hypothetical protein [Bacillales bacterium]